MNLFTPKEEQKMNHLLQSFETAETTVCIEANKQVGRHQWERSDGRKVVRDTLKATKRQIESMLRLMDVSDVQRFNQ